MIAIHVVYPVSGIEIRECSDGRAKVSYTGWPTCKFQKIFVFIFPRFQSKSSGFSLTVFRRLVEKLKLISV